MNPYLARAVENPIFTHIESPGLRLAVLVVAFLLIAMGACVMMRPAPAEEE